MIWISSPACNHAETVAERRKQAINHTICIISLMTAAPAGALTAVPEVRTRVKPMSTAERSVAAQSELTSMAAMGAVPWTRRGEEQSEESGPLWRVTGSGAAAAMTLWQAALSRLPSLSGEEGD